MKRIILLFLLAVLLIMPAGAYRGVVLNNTNIVQYKFDTPTFPTLNPGEYIIYFENINEVERDAVWFASNQTFINPVYTQDLVQEMLYQTQMNNLVIVIANSKTIQAKTNWTNEEIVQHMKVLAWHDEILAKGQMAILKALKWIQWT